MTMFVHRAERADALAGALADLMAEPLDDVFAEEIIAVPARGVERWLTQQLSHRLGPRPGRQDGICAGVRFPSPAALVNEVINGPARHADPWAPDALVWPLLEVIDESITQPWARTLGAHLGVGAGDAERAHRQGRRYAVARRIAGLFDAYATNRSAMLADWAAGRDTDGLDRSLPEDLQWQAELWRRVAARVQVGNPVDRRQEAIDRLRADPAENALPQRLSLFGPTRLPRSQLEVLDGLAEHRDVHLWLPHPSPALWERLEGRVETGSRRMDPTVTAARHPLLASLGRDSRELQLVLNTVDHADLHHPLPARPGTLLGRLQDNIRQDHTAARRPVVPQDRSVQIHACHGPARQVDVLREVLVGLLADDDTLEPRDVLVMCPDIEAYAPLIAAAFGLADVVPEDRGHPAHRLRVRLADRALTQTNPLLATVARLLRMAGGRVGASEVLDLAGWPPVRRRFGFDDDDLDHLARWVTQSGVRWGLDADHRGPFGLQRFPQNTWRAGLDRILLGVAMADEDQNRLGLALPLDDVGSGDVELAGRLAELLDRLQYALDALTGTRPLGEWLDALSEAVDLLTDVGTDDGWQRAEVRRELGDVAAAAGQRVSGTQLGLSDLRALLGGRLGGRPTRANFRTGTLTVCTMVPMRSVPHRVVALLGLDDGIYPRNTRPDGDDILSREPAIGERDSRGEDRQLMLDAILATTEHLVITYTGADERTGAVRPPAVPLGELMDSLDETAVAADGSPVLNQVLVRHPLQPFDAKNVIPGALGRPGAFSYDDTALQGARAAVGPRHRPRPFLARPLPPRPTADVDLAELIALLTHPARGFLRQRLDVATRFEEPEPSDSLTVELDSLQQWAVGDRILRDRLAGVDDAACRQAEWRRGVLPPGPLGQSTLDALLNEVNPLVERTETLMRPERRTVDVSVALAGGRQLRGTVAGVHGTAVVSVGYSKLGPKPQLSVWISLLALAAAHPEREWTAVAVGRGEPGRPRSATFGPIEQQKARTYLAALVELYDAGLCEPLPLPLKTSFAYAGSVVKMEGEDQAAFAARRSWSSGKFPGEDDDAPHTLVWGNRAPFEDVFGDPATRLGELSVQLWGPLLQHRRMTAL
ncbi:DNA helicase/exodeoxyribonuclease V, gamma subunit [Nakamurella panacisegetis]|uniref:RecBCD enzyme subunit RecC n=1 Tax=Nakamurella panacisegetis TaxID=1090615 RepID=A0A1H0KWX4_9ACTN|nr:exodeoxyribonuclease V subunit gamma [Nakamurella panacisegetis]SDO60438.1 DNA helicase/exodeoxyribonuclease V, gamma subunit [Nakamurella panacisegetis]